MPDEAPAEAQPYNPLSKRHLAESIERAILATEPSPLPPIKAFPGTGLYLLYYTGDFQLYNPITSKNAEGQLRVPMYVGKAVRPGSRSKLVDFDERSTSTPLLFNRLREHAESVQLASNLRLSDFRCRYLVLDEVFIPLGESLLIQHYRPLWNHTVKGFGLHDPGSGRTPQRSDWDTLHRGRESNWTSQLRAGRSVETIEEAVRKFLSGSDFASL